MMKKILAGLISIVLIAACGQRPADPAATDASDAASVQASVAGVDIARFRRDVEVLSSDDFGGRAPSTEGEVKTVAYLIAAFKQAGLVGGNDGSFVQDVPLVAITATSVAPLNFTDGEQSVVMSMGDEAVAWTKRVTDSVSVVDSDVVFVGYGIVAPEYEWDDYAGVDVTGKTVVILVNDPGFATGDDSLFTGKKMTYYGRWTYKFEEAARQGATGAIVVHQTAAAGYPWGVVQGGWTGPQFDLVAADNNMSRAVFEGWITTAAAQRLFSTFGKDFDALAAAASLPGFEPVAVATAVNTRIASSLERSMSKNVVALLPGTDAADETVAFSAHWDHLGTDPNIDGDGIFNGAVDNATGTAALLEMARALAKEKHRRSYLFIALTAEESGLLGSAWFATNPTVSLAKMAGLINIDAMNTIGPTRDVVVIGYGSSELENLLEQAAREQDRILSPETTPEKGFFYRSDHFNFAKQGVPVLYAKAGIDHLELGSEYGRDAMAKHIAERYHQPSDEIHDGWDLRGVEQDLGLYLGVARALGNSQDWPNWFAGNEFRQLRDASAQARAEDD